MKLIGVRQTLLAAGLIVGASCCACSHHATANNHSAAAKPGPEESFKLIVDTFKRRVEDTPVGFVASDPSRRSTMVGTNKVTSELIHPANPADPFKAVITVDSQSRYSIKRIKDSADDKADDQDAKSKGDESLLEKDDKKARGDESFDPAFSSKPPPDSKISHASEDVIARRPDKEVRKYELLYQNGRWTLVTELNKETEQAIQNAFKNALDTQI